MGTTIKPVPQGYHTATPSLIVRDASAAIAFYKSAFNATELYRLNMANDKIAHAEFKIGDSIFMITDENPDWGAISPETLGGSPVQLHLYVEDVDATFAAAIAAGGKANMPVELQFWGDRMGAIDDPFGHRWLIATHVEDVPESELQGRMAAAFGG